MEQGRQSARYVGRAGCMTKLGKKVGDRIRVRGGCVTDRETGVNHGSSPRLIVCTGCV